MVKIFIKTIKAKSMNVKQYGDKMEKAIRSETDIFERMYMRVSKGFSAPRPKYKKTFKRQFTRMVGTTSTDDRRMVNLDRGTKKRWAVMSQDFRPRTTPRTLGIKGRQGRSVIRGRRAMTQRGISARPGIEPRRWTDEIAKRREQPFLNKMRRAMKLAADHTF